jgi:hypothetical protein
LVKARQVGDATQTPGGVGETPTVEIIGIGDRIKARIDAAKRKAAGCGRSHAVIASRAARPRFRTVPTDSHIYATIRMFRISTPPGCHFE